MRRISSHAVLLVALLGTLGTSGCATTTGLLHWGPEKISTDSPQNPVVRVVAMWDPGEGKGTEGKTTRGFVGQIMFFTAKDKLPAKVNGALQIFVYDDEGTHEERIKPVAPYSYSPEALAGIFQVTELGACYSSFVPYPKPGMHKANCSLRLRYVPLDAAGKPNFAAAVMSEMAYVTLPGVDRTEQAKAEAERTEKAAAAKAQAEQRVQTLGSIKKPESKRIEAEPLTDAERERIIAEARAREAGDVTEDDAPPVRSRPMESVEPDEIVDEPADDNVADAASVGITPTPPPTLAASATQSSPARKLNHPLARWSDTEPFPEAEPPPAKRRHGLEGVSLDEPEVVQAVVHSTHALPGVVHPISAELPQPTLAEHPTFAVRPVEAPRPVDAAECQVPAPNAPRTWSGWLFTHGLQCLAALICLGYAGRCIRPVITLGRRIAAVLAEPHA